MKRNRYDEAFKKEAVSLALSGELSYAEVIRTAEWIYQQTFTSLEQARTTIFWFIEACYNRKRKHSTLGYLSPVNFESTNIKSAA